MNKFAAMECPTTFNVLTQLKSCDEYKKELQESMDPLKYRFDLRPGPMCFMPGQAFQGLRTSTMRGPPPQLLDMEMTLHSMPLKEQDNRYVIKDIHNAAPPAMPAILSNRMIIPECKEIMQWQRTKIRRIDEPQISQRMDKMGLYLTNYMRPGRNTRDEMRDAFKAYEKQKAANSDIYGVGKFDPRALKPGTNPNCTNADSDLDCMHVYGPDAIRTGTVIDQTLPFKDLVARQGGGVAAIAGGAAGSAAGGGGGIGAGAGVSASTIQAMRVAESIDPNASYVNLLKDVRAKNGCNARFYNYSPNSC